MGSISLWRYAENTSNYPGWNISADSTGADSLIELLHCLKSDGTGATRTVLLTPPDSSLLAIPNNKGGKAKYIAAEKLRLLVSDNTSTWYFPSEASLVPLTFGSDWFDALEQGLARIKPHQGDYSIGSSSEDQLQLWFW
ncbi:MAG: hypothetical protein Q4G39_05565 [Brachymonas sp.]|nr:hypothetical protein [Brachymonas sp.]